MSHDHHSCVCAHTSLAYCNICMVVYCTQCKKEWIERTVWYSGNNWNAGGGITLTQTACNSHQ